MPNYRADPSGSTQLAIDICAFCRRYLVFVLPAIALLLWLDAKLFSLVYRRFGGRMAQKWFWGVVMLLGITAGWLIVAMFLPKWSFGRIVGP